MLKPLLMSMVVGLVAGCADAPERQTEQAEQGRQGAPHEQSCYLKGWWAETGPLLYRRFGEDERPKPALMGDEPLSAAAAPDECP
ncbi:MAG: hypothetical protein ACRERX_10855 [Pseudomonas sp.]